MSGTRSRRGSAPRGQSGLPEEPLKSWKRAHDIPGGGAEILTDIRWAASPAKTRERMALRDEAWLFGMKSTATIMFWSTSPRERIEPFSDVRSRQNRGFTAFLD